MTKQFEIIENLVKKMAEHEETLASLYEHYAKLYPHFKWWGKLSKDERMHAFVLKKLLSKTDFKKLAIKPKVFLPKEIERSITEIKKETLQASKSNLFIALNTAFRIENKLIEQGYFKIFYSNDQDFQKVFSYLQEATEKHSQKIYLELKKLLPKSKI